jgi:hypothetical protein
MPPSGVWQGRQTTGFLRDARSQKRRKFFPQPPGNGFTAIRNMTWQSASIVPHMIEDSAVGDRFADLAENHQHDPDTVDARVSLVVNATSLKKGALPSEGTGGIVMVPWEAWRRSSRRRSNSKGIKR